MNDSFWDPDFWIALITILMTLVVFPLWMAFH